MADGINRFLGDTPGRTLVKLIVVSLIVASSWPSSVWSRWI